MAVRLRDNAAVIVDLKSCDRQLVTNPGVNANTVITVGEGKIIAWDLPPGDCVLDARANIHAHDSVWTLCSIIQHRVPNGHTPHQYPPISATLPPPGDQTRVQAFSTCLPEASCEYHFREWVHTVVYFGRTQGLAFKALSQGRVENHQGWKIRRHRAGASRTECGSVRDAPLGICPWLRYCGGWLDT